MTIAPINVGTWDPQQYRAYSQVAKQQNWNLDIAQAVPYGQAEQVLDQWGQQGVNVVFATDSGFGDSVLKAAAKYPNTVFVVMSSLSSTNGLANVAAYAPNYCQMGYMAGQLAAGSSSSGKVGVVSGTAVPAGQQFFNGVQQGVSAYKSSDSAEIQYSGDWTDPVKKSEVARALIAKGDDVLMSFDTVPTATDQTIQSMDKKIIGIFADESAFASHAVLTSIVIDWSGYAQTVSAVMSHSFKPGIHVGNFADGMLKVLPLASGSSSLQPTVDKVKSGLADGSITISGNCG